MQWIILMALIIGIAAFTSWTLWVVDVTFQEIERWRRQRKHQRQMEYYAKMRTMPVMTEYLEDGTKVYKTETPQMTRTDWKRKLSNWIEDHISGNPSIKSSPGPTDFKVRADYKIPRR